MNNMYSNNNHVYNENTFGVIYKKMYFPRIPNIPNFLKKKLENR